MTAEKMTKLISEMRGGLGQIAQQLQAIDNQIAQLSTQKQTLLQNKIATEGGIRTLEFALKDDEPKELPKEENVVNFKKET